MKAIILILVLITIADTLLVAACAKLEREAERKEDMYMSLVDEISIPTEVEADGFITPPDALERTDMHTAKPAEKCIYPKCEECDKYHGLNCTVPMVVSKQNWLLTAKRLYTLEIRLTELEKLVTDEILGSR